MLTLPQHCPNKAAVVWLPPTRLLRDVPAARLSRKVIEMAGGKSGGYAIGIAQPHLLLSSICSASIHLKPSALYRTLNL